MALNTNFKTLDIREVLDATHMRGRDITFIDDFSSEEILSLFQAAEMFEPFMRTGLTLLNGIVPWARMYYRCGWPIWISVRLLL